MVQCVDMNSSQQSQTLSAHPCATHASSLPQTHQEETFACFLVEENIRYVALRDIEHYPDSLLAHICKECPDCLNGVPVHVKKDLSLFDWIIEVYKSGRSRSDVPHVGSEGGISI